MVHGAWFMVHGAWFMAVRFAHGSWGMVHGAWFMGHGSWPFASLTWLRFRVCGFFPLPSGRGGVMFFSPCRRQGCDVFAAAAPRENHKLAAVFRRVFRRFLENLGWIFRVARKAPPLLGFSFWRGERYYVRWGTLLREMGHVTTWICWPQDAL